MFMNQFKQHVIKDFMDKNVAKGNFIHMNYSQGILLEEGSSAQIVGNHITKNIKANIALGGCESEKS